MENAVKALEYAFAILIFIIALTTATNLLSEVKFTSDIVFSKIDTKQHYVDAEIPSDELDSAGNLKYKGRIVGIESIVPTLYRYYKENYIVEFYKTSTSEESTTVKKIITFDLNRETTNRELWTGNPEVDAKKRVDLFLNGGKAIEYTVKDENRRDKTVNGIGGIINSQVHDLLTDIAFESNIKNTDKEEIAKEGFYEYCKGKKFSEEYAYVLEKPTEETLEEEVTRIVIRYIEI